MSLVINCSAGIQLELRHINLLRFSFRRFVYDLEAKKICLCKRLGSKCILFNFFRNKSLGKRYELFITLITDVFEKTL